MKGFLPTDCPKCGEVVTSVRYIPQNFNWSPYQKEAMRRTCGRCGYHWDEEPLDKEEGKRG